MHYLYIIFSILSMTASKTIIDFDKGIGIEGWMIVNDGVMGGLSSSSLIKNEEGHAQFSGVVRLENNGGFASVRYRVIDIESTEFSAFKLHVKGDGKRYQFRAKKGIRDRHSYTKYFETNGNWEEIIIPFDQMKPTFRGRLLAMPPLDGNSLSELGFLIGNGVKESFALQIKRVELI